jgi:hypothetical protein
MRRIIGIVLAAIGGAVILVAPASASDQRPTVQRLRSGRQSNSYADWVNCMQQTAERWCMP